MKRPPRGAISCARLSLERRIQEARRREAYRLPWFIIEADALAVRPKGSSSIIEAAERAEILKRHHIGENARKTILNR